MATIDFHSHVLPGADHGSSSPQVSVKQLELMTNMGTAIAVATPHFYPNKHTFEDFSKKIELAIDKLHEASPDNSPALIVGAEVLVCRHLENMKELDSLCIRGTKVLLLELPFKPLAEKHVETVDALIGSGYTVVLAHIDRYIKNSSEFIDKMLSLGALAQINAEGLKRLGTRRKLMRYVKDTDRVCAIGSDLHGSKKSDYKKFVSCKKILGEHFDVIMSRTEALLKNAETITFK